MEIKPIKTKADHRAALKEVEGLMSAGKGTPDGERLDVLVTLIEAYERKHFPMALPDRSHPLQHGAEGPDSQRPRADDRPDQPCLRSTQRQAAVDAPDDPAPAPRIGGTGGIPDRGNRGTAGSKASLTSPLLLIGFT